MPATPETAAIFFGVWKLGAILLSMSVLYGDDGIRHRLSDSEATLLVTDAENAPRFDRSWAPDVFVLDADSLAAASTDFICADTSADDPAQLYYTSGTTGLAKGIVHAHRYILGHEEFRYCHEVQDGERFHGMGEWAWAAGIAPLLGPWRLGAVQCVYRREGGFDPHKQLDFLSRHQVTNVFTTPTAMRAMMAIDDAGTRYPQAFRRVCSAGEPLNPEAIRWFREQYGVTVLDYYGLTESYPLVRELPVPRGARGVDGQADAGLGRQLLDEDEQPVKQGERGEICLRARSNPHYPLGYWRNDEASAETFGGEWFHTKDAAVQDEDGYVWYVGRADDVIIAAGYRIGPFEVESACLEHPAVREAAAVASPDELRGNVVKAFIVLADGHAPSDELADEIKSFVRERLSAYAYPRRIEFVGDLPKTLTGKIRRIELRQLELDRAAPLRLKSVQLRLDDVALGTRVSAAEARDGERFQIERRRQPERELGEVLADDRCLLEAVARESGRIEETGRFLGLADQRVVVRAHFVVAPPARTDPELGQRRQAQDGVRRELLDRLLAAAEGERRSFAVEVETGREVDRQRELAREVRGVLGEEHPAALPGERQLETHGRRELPRPDSRSADDAVGSDRAAGRLDADDAIAVHQDPRRGARLLDVRASLRGAARVALNDEIGGHIAGNGTERRGQHVVDGELRDELLRLRRVDQPRAALLQRDRRLELPDVGGRAQQEEVAPESQVEVRSDLRLEALQPPDRLEPDPDVQLVGEECAHAAGAVAGRAGAERVALEQNGRLHSRARRGNATPRRRQSRRRRPQHRSVRAASSSRAYAP